MHVLTLLTYYAHRKKVTAKMVFLLVFLEGANKFEGVALPGPHGSVHELK